MGQRVTTSLPFAEMEFVAEWEARLFAIVASLIGNGLFTWPEFRSHLTRLNGSLTDDVDEMKLATDLSLWARALRDLLHERGLLT